MNRRNAVFGANHSNPLRRASLALALGLMSLVSSIQTHAQQVWDKQCDPIRSGESFFQQSERALSTGFCEVPLSGAQIDFERSRRTNASYSLDCTTTSTRNPATYVNLVTGQPCESLTSGMCRQYLESNDVLDCSGPAVVTGPTSVVYELPERFTIVESAVSSVQVPRTSLQGFVSGGSVEVATLYDYVLRDTTDNRLVLAFQLDLVDTLSDGNEVKANPFEVNFFFRRGNTGLELGSAASKSYSIGTKNSLELYNMSRSVQGALGALPIPSADWVRFQTDINVTEGNPTHDFFYLKSDAECATFQPDAMRIRQAGEEGQPTIDFTVPAFAFSPACQVAAEGQLESAVSFPFVPDAEQTTTVSIPAACAVPDAGGATFAAVGGCVEVTSDQIEGQQAAIIAADPATWPNVCLQYSQAELDAVGVDEAALLGKKCSGGECCIVGGEGPDACASTCTSGNCGGLVAVKSANSFNLTAAAVLGEGVKAQYCIATPTFSEFGLVTAVEASQTAAIVPMPLWSMLLLGSGLALVARRIRLVI